MASSSFRLRVAESGLSILSIAWIAFFAVAPTVSAQAILDLDRTSFIASTGSAPIPIPDGDSVPGSVGLGDFECVDKLVGFTLPLGAPRVTITAPLAVDYICIADPGEDSVSDPQAIVPTIVGNGEDDYVLVFAPPVASLGLDLLTNHFAVETITVNFTDGTSEVFADAVLGTDPNGFEFVGLISSVDIQSVAIDTTGGGTLNEGIFGILVPSRFVRADCNGDSVVDIGDPVSLLSILFSGEPGPECSDACDSNDDGAIDIADAIFALNYLFVIASPAPPTPFPSCGLDPTADDLECVATPCP